MNTGLSRHTEIFFSAYKKQKSTAKGGAFSFEMKPILQDFFAFAE